MTAPGAAGQAGTPDVERLAEALGEHDGGPGWWKATDEEERESHRRTAAALLPVVAEMKREAQSEALEALAAEMDGVVRLCSVPLWETAAKVRDRAAALRAGGGQ